MAKEDLLQSVYQAVGEVLFEWTHQRIYDIRRRDIHEAIVPNCGHSNVSDLTLDSTFNIHLAMHLLQIHKLMLDYRHICTLDLFLKSVNKFVRKDN